VARRLANAIAARHVRLSFAMETPPASLNPIIRLRQIVSALRSPDGCPWDREQDHLTLRTTLIEEAYETLGAIERADDIHLCEELGDLLLQVVMHAQLAEERGAFNFDKIAAGIAEKLVRRHPHVFGDTDAPDTASVLKNWDAIKRSEKSGHASRLDGIETALPELMRAQKIQKKAARAGFDWPDATGALDKMREEILELCEAHASGDIVHTHEELGDLLFACVNAARLLGADAELTLRAASEKFERRFRAMESKLASLGREMESCTLEEMDAVWDQMKVLERQ